MSRPTAYLDEVAQWLVASEILAQFDEEVGDYLLEQVKAALADGDRNGAD